MIETLAIDSLRPYAKNARTHSAAQVRQLAESISTYGFTFPILVTEEFDIIAGHGRLAAAKLLGLEEVPVIVARGWDEAKIRAYRILDNKVALNSEWDTAVLETELRSLLDYEVDLGSIGFNDAELSRLLSDGTEAGDIDARKEWGGMPSFEQADKTSAYQCVVHFKTLEDMQEFARRIEQPMTERTRSVWFPPDEIGRIADKRWEGDTSK